jgi:ATP-dependent Lon protease
VTWEAGVLEAIVRGWTREAGVRDLERRIGRVARRLARNVGLPSPGAGARPPVTVRASELPATLGPAPYADDDTPPADHAVGVARGLAYGAAGGEVIEIEVSVVPGRGRVQLTGALGEAMKESASAAVSYVRARAAPLGVDPDFQRTRDVHIHLPLAATPKDGPSAGVPIAAALVSALTGIPVRGDVALTGELTLRGRVLPVGGLAEKAGAAARRRVAHVVLPRANAAALDELAADVRAACAWHPVASMDDALAVALCAGGAAASPDRSPSGAPIAAAPDGGVS